MDYDGIDAEDTGERASVLSTGTTEGRKVLHGDEKGVSHRIYEGYFLTNERTWLLMEYPRPSLSDRMGRAILSLATDKKL